MKKKSIDTLLSDKRWATKKKMILGGGSNILFTQDFPGLVIKNQLKGIQHVDENKEHLWIRVAAGENWHSFVCYCVASGYGGIENLSLIPGTVGAAPIQNIGAYGVEIASVFESLEAVELATGEKKIFNKTDCQFSYRSSIFKKSHKDRYFITCVTMRLDKNPILNLNYGAIKETVDTLGCNPSIASVSKAVMQIRKKKLPDPNTFSNAGSFFKNPVIDNHHFARLHKNYPNIPNYPAHTGHTKISAAWLIEQCGWKGKRQNQVGVDQNQALVLVHYGNGRSEELLTLAQLIKESVEEEFQISLLQEVNVI